MRNGTPIAYALHRALWSILHLALVALAVVALLVWFVHDHRGADLVSAISNGLADAQHTVARAIPFPWGR